MSFRIAKVSVGHMIEMTQMIHTKPFTTLQRLLCRTNELFSLATSIFGLSRESQLYLFWDREVEER